MRKISILLMFSLLLTMIISFSSNASESEISIGTYAKEGFSVSSDSIVSGNVLVENGSVSSGEYIPNGNYLYYMPGVQIPTTTMLGNVIKTTKNTKLYTGEPLHFEELNLPGFPELKQRSNLEIQENRTNIIKFHGWYENITINKGKLIIQTDTDLKIRVDHLKLNGEIIVKGTGNVVFYIDELECAEGSKINFDMNEAYKNACVLYISSKTPELTLSKMYGCFDLYAPDTQINLINSSFIDRGDIYTKKPLKLATFLAGYLYTPSAEIQIADDTTILGRVVCNKMYGGSVTITGGEIELKNLDLISAPILPIENNMKNLDFKYAYFYGYEGGTESGYNDPIKRDAASAIIYRILKQCGNLVDHIPPKDSTYQDLPKDSWAFNAISYMESNSVFDPIAGYIHPTKDMTRAEIAKMVSIILGINPKDNKTTIFGDLDETNEYYPYLKAMIDWNYMYGDGNIIRPNDTLTRAEYVTIINRIIGRAGEYVLPNSDEFDTYFLDIKDFVNKASECWIYENIMRATFGYDDEKTDGMYQINLNRRLPLKEIDYN